MGPAVSVTKTAPAPSWRIRPPSASTCSMQSPSGCAWCAGTLLLGTTTAWLPVRRAKPSSRGLFKVWWEGRETEIVTPQQKRETALDITETAVLPCYVKGGKGGRCNAHNPPFFCMPPLSCPTLVLPINLNIKLGSVAVGTFAKFLAWLATRSRHLA